MLSLLRVFVFDSDFIISSNKKITDGFSIFSFKIPIESHLLFSFQQTQPSNTWQPELTFLTLFCSQVMGSWAPDNWFLTHYSKALCTLCTTLINTFLKAKIRSDFSKKPSQKNNATVEVIHIQNKFILSNSAISLLFFSTFPSFWFAMEWLEREGKPRKHKWN